MEASLLIGAQTPVKSKTLSQGRSVTPKPGTWMGNVNPDPWDGMSGVIPPKFLKLFLESSEPSEPKEMMHLPH